MPVYMFESMCIHPASVRVSMHVWVRAFVFESLCVGVRESVVALARACGVCTGCGCLDVYGIH